jgi:hypothetical protein
MKEAENVNPEKEKGFNPEKEKGLKNPEKGY